MNRVRRLILDEAGADATEYALLAGLVAVAIIGGATFLGDRLGNAFNGVGNNILTTVP